MVRYGYRVDKKVIIILGILGLSVALATFLMFYMRRKWDLAMINRNISFISPIVKKEKPVYIWMEAEDAERILAPMERSKGEGLSGNGYIQLREGVGARLFSPHVNGKAIYFFDCEEAGEYVFWARVRWTDGCGNTIYIGIDDFDFNEESLAWTFGNDSTYNYWHWVKGRVYRLKKGRHELRLANREDGIGIDKILLTTDLNCVPKNLCELSYSNEFNVGNTFEWCPEEPGVWRVMSDRKHGNKAYYLCPLKGNREEEAFLNGEIYRYKDFIFKSRVRCGRRNSGNGGYKIIFNRQDEFNYYFAEVSREGLSLKRMKEGKQEVIKAERGDRFLDDKYHDVELLCHHGRIWLRWDNEKIMDIRKDALTGGLLGLASIYGDVYFDKIECTPLEDIYFEDIFYDDVYHYQSHPLNWEPKRGNWNACASDTYSYVVNGKDEIFSISGKKYWYNYSFEVVSKANGHCGIGICFYYQDRDNYYLFRWADDESACDYAGKKQLIKVIDGERVILVEKEGGYEDPRRLYTLKARVYENNIKVFIDDKEIFNISDSTLTYGRIGLYAENAEWAEFDDVRAVGVDLETKEEEAVPVTLVNSTFSGFHETGKGQERVITEVSKRLFGVTATNVNKEIFEDRWVAVNGTWKEVGGSLYGQGTEQVADIWCKGAFFGDVGIEFDAKIASLSEGSLNVVFYEENEEVSRAYIFHIKPSPEPLFQLLCDEEIIAETRLPLLDLDGIFHVKLGKVNKFLQAFINGEPVLSHELDGQPLRTRPAIYVRQGKVYLDNIEMVTYPQRSYSFSIRTDAAADFSQWLLQTGRWTVSNEDFTRGLFGARVLADPTSVVWNRYEHTEDVAIEIYCRPYYTAQYEMGMIMCGDGEDTSSGYEFIIGQEKLQLLKKGEVVAQAPVELFTRKEWNWYKIQKRKGRLRIYVSDKFGSDRIGLEYIDKKPLGKGKIALEVKGKVGATFLFRAVNIY